MGPRRGYEGRTMSTYLIRPARRDEAAALADFQLRMADETEGLHLNPATVAAGVAAALDDPARGQYWVAEVGGEPAGCAMVTPEWSDWRNGWVWWIQSVYIRPEHRRRGVFRAIYAHLRQLVEVAPDLYGLRLYVARTNAAAQEVYQSLGMAGDHYVTFEWMK